MTLLLLAPSSVWISAGSRRAIRYRRTDPYLSRNSPSSMKQVSFGHYLPPDAIQMLPDENVAEERPSALWEMGPRVQVRALWRS